MKKVLALTLILVVACFSCQEKQTTGSVVFQQDKRKKAEEEAFIEGNKKIIQLEQDEIDLFVQRYEWDMKISNSGLRYRIIEEGHGKRLQEGDQVKLDYEILLLNGEKIYDSNERGELCFRIEQSGDIVGLHEAVKMLKEGGKAGFIIPSYLGYGMVGDGDKIANSTPFVLIIRELILDNNN